MQKVALYCRVARKDDEAYRAQQKRLMEYAAQSGITDFCFFGDNGESGITADRPMHQKLLHEIENGAVSEVVFSKFSRIARNLLVVENFFNLCNEKKVIITFLDDTPTIYSSEKQSDAKKEIQPNTIESLS